MPWPLGSEIRPAPEQSRFTPNPARISVSNPSDPDVLQAPSPSLRGFLVTWAVFWVLQATVSVQDYQLSGHAGLWQLLFGAAAAGALGARTRVAACRR